MAPPMALSPGDRLGPYEISGTLGAGGMGEVYRALDTALNRAVALKVLPDAFASDADRLARFAREAQALAALNHPGIAQIYGIHQRPHEGGHDVGIRALVMELVEGEDLSQRLARGPLPLDEALAAAAQIADAVEAAHEQGIIHRDLKPANIKLRPDGAVKVLDFGLAKAMDATAGMSTPASSLSPTLTSPVLATGIGMLLGTAAYMSPEQAKGRIADKRSDIWAFGCVLFEMLTGRPLFTGETVTEVLASVMKDTPALDAVPADTPPAIRHLLARCLERDPKQRLRDIGEARIAIADTLARADQPPVAPAPDERFRAVPSRPPAWLPWSVAAAAAIAAGIVILIWAPWRTTTPPAPLRLSTDLGVEASLVTTFGAGAVLSPDGTTLALVVRRTAKDQPQLYRRSLDSLQAVALPGTNGARDPFFSPDGDWIGFFAEGKLKKVAITGGSPIVLADAVNGRGGWWSAEDDAIVFQPVNAVGLGQGTLMRVPSSGGTATRLIPLADGELTQRWPQVLPGGAVLFTSHSGTTSGYENATIVVQPLPGGERKVIVRNGYFGRYAASGHLLYMSNGTVFAAPFDLRRLELTGQAVPVIEGVTTNAGFGGAQFSVADNGALVYAPGSIDSTANNPLVLFDRSGAETPLHSTPANWLDLRFAPDGTRVAAVLNDGNGTSIWSVDTAKDARSRFTFARDSQNAFAPAWTADGRRLAYVLGGVIGDIFWQRADGGDSPQPLTRRTTQKSDLSFHPSGTHLAFAETTPQSKTSWDILVMPLTGSERGGWTPGAPRAFVDTPARETEPAFSPDGRWIAYRSQETGRPEIYVRPFPGPGGKWQISTDGGVGAAWSATRPEIVFAGPGGRVMAATYTVKGDAFAAERPRPWTENTIASPWSLHPDGSRIVAAARGVETSVKQDKVVVVLNFFDEVRRRARG
jgi:serine/threonine protein kinase/Tol biopolymer transport system component